VVLDRHRQTARIGTIQRTHARHHLGHKLFSSPQHP
jgi:hypothetical protein